MTVIYTPGHNLVTDTLIIHGVVKYISVLGVKNAVVERVGERYRVEAEGVGSGRVEFVEPIVRAINVYEEYGDARLLKGTVTYKLIRGDIAMGAMGRLHVFKAGLTSLSPSWLEAFIENHHCDGKHVLPPHLSAVFNLSGERGVCDVCFTFANLGFLYGATVAVMKKPGRRDVVYMVPTPRGRAAWEDVFLMQQVASLLEISVGDVPTLAVPVVWLSWGAAMDIVDGPFDLLVWRVESIRGQLRVMDWHILDLTKLTDVVVELWDGTTDWPRCVKVTLYGNPHVLADLANYATQGGDGRKVAQGLLSGKNTARFCAGAVEVLAK
ncbi:MAG: hypothetical protein ACK4SY_08700 [Pyrobaculum sp.]